MMPGPRGTVSTERPGEPLRVSPASPNPDGAPPRTVLIVARGRQDLRDSLARMFPADAGTVVIEDRRRGDRRRGDVTAERRRADRRAPTDVERELRSRGWTQVTREAATGEAGAPSAAPRRHRCIECGSENVRREVRRSWSERWLSRIRRPYYCFDCGARFYDRPLGETRGQVPVDRRWRAAALGAALLATIGGGMMLSATALPVWTLGLNLLVVGLVAVVVSVAGARLTREARATPRRHGAGPVDPIDGASG